MFSEPQEQLQVNVWKHDVLKTFASGQATLPQIV